MVAAITKRHDVPLAVYQTTLLHVASVEVLPRDIFSTTRALILGVGIN